VVVFCDDKLLGSPRSDIILGKKSWVEKIERDPLMRAFRLDKMSLAALEATLLLYRDPETAFNSIPTLRMLDTRECQLRERAESFAAQLQKNDRIQSVRTFADESFVGGGSVPDQALPAVVVGIRVRGMSDEELARRLRSSEPAVLTRRHAGEVLVDLRTVSPEQEAFIRHRLDSVVSGNH